MAPTILVIGATGNTGLASLPSVQVLEYAYTEITTSWLIEHEVQKAFVATHTEPTHFSEESQFLLVARNAGVKYIVRISTTAANIHADTLPYYARNHWAIETLLATPEFLGLKWTSLQPNSFAHMFLYTAVAFVREYRATGTVPETLAMVADENAKVGLIDPADVGVFASKLLLCSDSEVEKHSGKKYVLNGPTDITGRETVDLVEKYLDGKKVKEVKYRDREIMDTIIAQSPYSKTLLRSLRHETEVYWNEKCTAATTSKEVLEFAAPKVTP
ncbi:uncharacterized protein EAE97_006462 [Botrytis byssoidea]|uniref:NmrA-like domain-containing protein n=1 Tax=Botrytis byssoidea TaxID=139641 RepID=A0A9P5M293_9HELO|nr:uncharacterized protein EAE97_006462 [Botrytis byssoidea]KAF7941625.1 hypothetical protein EAE97_006462 [Botrytis byssoidea]